LLWFGAIVIFIIKTIYIFLLEASPKVVDKINYDGAYKDSMEFACVMVFFKTSMVIG